MDVFHPRVSGSRFQVWPGAMGLDCAGLENHFLPSQYPWLCKCPHRKGSGCGAVYFGCGLEQTASGERAGRAGHRFQGAPDRGLSQALEGVGEILEMLRDGGLGPSEGADPEVTKRVSGVPLLLLWTLGGSGLRHGRWKPGKGQSEKYCGA